MTHPKFFGYGSLVNRATHSYPNAAKASAYGWRRAWVQTSHRPFAYLSAIKAPGHSIDGLIADVPDGDWTALDEREDAYERIEDSNNIQHDLPQASTIAIYSVPEHARVEVPESYPILLSYLDVVLQGYLQEFGPKGGRHFVETTDGWHTPILNDRAEPIYPRHQHLRPDETDWVDAILRDLGATLVTRDE